MRSQAGAGDLESEVHNEEEFEDRQMLFDTSIRKELSRTFGGTLVQIGDDAAE